MGCDRKLTSVILLGIAFMLVFAAFHTWANIQKTVVDSIINDDPSFTGDAFYSTAITYVLFAVFNWASPSVISSIGPKSTMIIGSIIYSGFIMSFLCESTWILYAMSALLGIAAAILWTAQGNYFTLNSTKETITRNSGIFWALLQCSLLIGNIYVYVALLGKETVDATTRKTITFVLGMFGVIGVISVAILPSVRKDESTPKEEDLNAMEALIGATRLFVTKKMALLCVTFFYTGVGLTFWSGVYSPAIGATITLENCKELVGLSGVFLGVGEVLAGVIFGVMGSKWRTPAILTGFLTSLIAYILTTINIPNQAVLGNTYDTAIIETNAYIAIVCSFLLGFGDACYNTQILAYLGDVYATNSASAFAIFKCVQSFAAAVGFFYSTHLPLYDQQAVLIISMCLGTATFIAVERKDVADDEVAKEVTKL